MLIREKHIYDNSDTIIKRFWPVCCFQALPQLCSEHQDALGFNDDLQHLYAAIVAHGNTRKRKRSEEDRPPAKEPDLTSSLGWFEMWLTLVYTWCDYKPSDPTFDPILTCDCRWIDQQWHRWGQRAEPRQAGECSRSQDGRPAHSQTGRTGRRLQELLKQDGITYLNVS